MLALIVQHCISEAADAAACAVACSQLRSAAKGARLAVRLSPSQCPRKCRLALHSLCRQFPGVRQGTWTGATIAGANFRMAQKPECWCSVAGIWMLDLSGCAVEDGDVAHLLRGLPQLQLLLLNSCRKLTPAVIDCLLPGPTRDHAPCSKQAHSVTALDSSTARPLASCTAARLRGLGLARCFQLDDRALSGVLQQTGACRGASEGLHSVVLSHLDLRHWLPATGLHSSSALRVLALHNCEKLPASALYVRHTTSVHDYRGCACACSRDGCSWASLWGTRNTGNQQ